MARPEKHTVDYFPFYCKEGPAMYYIENKYEHGFAVWIKILRQLAVTDFHFLNLADEKTVMFLTAKCRVDQNILFCIIEDLIRFGEFDKDLWQEAQILTGEKFLDSIGDAYKKRNAPSPTLLGLRSHLIGLRLLKGDGNEVTPSDKPHTILYDSIEKNTIEYYIKKAEKNLEILKADHGWHEVSSMQLKVDLSLFTGDFPTFLKTISPTDLNKSEGELKRYYYNWFKKRQNDGTKKQFADNKRSELSDLEDESKGILSKTSGLNQH